MNERDLDLALDRLGAQHVRRTAPPALRVRVLAVPIETPRRRSWLPRFDAGGFDMFSVVKFIAAGVIVALFGGFLLTGVLTTQQGDEVLPAAVTKSPEPEATSAPMEPTQPPDSPVRTDILPGVALTVEEVEPGVLRVVSDGQMDLDSFLETVASAWDLAIGPDGSAWVAYGDRWSPDGDQLLSTFRLHRLGDSTTPTEFRDGIDLEVAPDGTVWQITKGKQYDKPYTIRSFDGSRWKTWMNSRKRNPKAIEVAPDGTVWAMWQERPRPVGRYQREDTFLGYLDGGSWKKARRWFPRGAKTQGIMPGDLTITDDGEIRGYGGGSHDLARYVDGAWEEIVLEDVSGHRLEGPVGTVWYIDDEALSHDPPLPDTSDGPFLRRSDGGEWQTWDVSESIPEARSWASTGEAYVSPDGALWVSPHLRRFDSVDDRWRDIGDGLVRFDGTSTHHVLRGHFAGNVHFGPHGYVWTIAARDDRPSHLYVITPEAMAVAEE